MKNRTNFVKIALMFILFMVWSIIVLAQAPPPPPDENGSSTNQGAGTGGSAPIGSGIAILLSMGAAWGGRKVYQAYQDRDRLL